MYIDLSHQKLKVIIGIAAALVLAIGVFLSANNAWALIAHAEEKISMAGSEFWYWLLYRLPEGNMVSAVKIPDGDAHSIPVLLYHGEGVASNMPTRVFVDQMRSLKEAGWRTITMEQFDAWERGQIQLPERSFLLTFDDGRKDTYYQADPILKDLGFHAVMFVITGFSVPESGKLSNFYLNKTELADMAASGRWELESHGDADHATYAVQTTTDLSQTASTTQGHFLSNKFWDTEANRFETDAEFSARLERDMRISQKVLQDDFGREVIAFAYPFNDFGQDSVNFRQSQDILDRIVPSIYAYALYQTWAQNGDTFNYPLANNGPGSRPYMIKRIEPVALWSGQDLLERLNAGVAKPLPYTSGIFGPEWVGSWGSATRSQSGIALAAKADTSGADVFLNGSGWWRDYYFTATVQWHGGSDISLLARNLNDENFLACTFSARRVIIERHFRGGQSPIASLQAPLDTSRADLQIGMGVFGNTVTCYEGDVAIVSGPIPPSNVMGGIGIEIWDKTTGVARATITAVAVAEEPPARKSGAPARPLASPAIPNTGGALPLPTVIPLPSNVPPAVAPMPEPSMISLPSTTATSSSSATSSPAATSSIQTGHAPFDRFMKTHRRRDNADA